MLQALHSPADIHECNPNSKMSYHGTKAMLRGAADEGNTAWQFERDHPKAILSSSICHGKFFHTDNNKNFPGRVLDCLGVLKAPRGGLDTSFTLTFRQVLDLQVSHEHPEDDENEVYRRL